MATYVGIDEIQYRCKPVQSLGHVAAQVSRQGGDDRKGNKGRTVAQVQRVVADEVLVEQLRLTGGLQPLLSSVMFEAK